MTTPQKYWLTVVIGWAAPLALACTGNMAWAMGAVAIAWWHGYHAARLEAVMALERRSGP